MRKHELFRGSAPEGLLLRFTRHRPAEKDEEPGLGRGDQDDGVVAGHRLIELEICKTRPSELHDKAGRRHANPLPRIPLVKVRKFSVPLPPKTDRNRLLAEGLHWSSVAAMARDPSRLLHLIGR